MAFFFLAAILIFGMDFHLERREIIFPALVVCNLVRKFLEMVEMDLFLLIL
jgi:hypothetical protein